nr:competence protein CoiA family protein [Candidatus Sigynarchaeota archaeon]
MPTTALFDGKVIEASSLLEYAAKLKKQGKSYLCRNKHCDHPLLELCKGPKIPPYFRHVTLCDCEKYGEAETFAHAAMKDWLVKLFGGDGPIAVEYYGLDGVRPDVFWYGKYAFEMQHSPIKIAEVNRRNVKYREQGLVPIWFFHADEGETARFERGNYRKLHEYGFRTFTAIERMLSSDGTIPVFYIRFLRDRPDEPDAFHFVAPLFAETREIENPYRKISNKDELLQHIRDVIEKPEPEPEPKPEPAIEPPPQPETPIEPASQPVVIIKPPAERIAVARPRRARPVINLPPLNDIHPISREYWYRNKITYIIGDNDASFLADMKKKRGVFIAKPYDEKQAYRVTVDLMRTVKFFFNIRPVVNQMYDRLCGKSLVPETITRKCVAIDESVFFLIYSDGSKITLGIKPEKHSVFYIRVYPLAFIGLANWLAFNLLSLIPVNVLSRAMCPNKPINTPCPAPSDRPEECKQCNLEEREREMMADKERAPIRPTPGRQSSFSHRKITIVETAPPVVEEERHVTLPEPVKEKPMRFGFFKKQSAIYHDGKLFVGILVDVLQVEEDTIMVALKDGQVNRLPKRDVTCESGVLAPGMKSVKIRIPRAVYTSSFSDRP